MRGEANYPPEERCHKQPKRHGVGGAGGQSALIFSGDGTEGCKHIKVNGGKTFAQDMSVEVDSMPLSAQVAGCADFVLPLNKIPDKLKRLANVLKI